MGTSRWLRVASFFLATFFLYIFSSHVARGATAVAGKNLIVLEAEDAMPKGAALYRDDRASKKKCVVARLTVTPSGPLPIFAGGANLPAGDYLVTAFVEAAPVEVMHALDITFKSGDVERHIRAVDFDGAAGGYQPIRMRVFHNGGRLSVTLDVRSAGGFEGMRKGSSTGENDAAAKVKSADSSRLLTDEKSKAEIDSLDLDEGADIHSLTALDHRVACDRVEIAALADAPPPAVVARVDVDKVHYAPNETVKATVALNGGAAGGQYALLAEDVTEIDSAREVYRKDIALLPGKSQDVSIEFALDGKTEFGHELRCSLQKDGKPVHTARQYFGVSSNVYRIGITGDYGGSDKQSITQEQIVEIMRRNKQLYANYFEVFAWAPCDYSEMTPDAELFWSGQTQYAGSVSKYKAMLAEAHRLGIKAISYGKSCGGGIAGFQTFRRLPELFARSAATGTASDAFNTFYLERMLENDYSYATESGDKRQWQHWASLWVNPTDAAVDFGADELIASSKMFGWDGVRWDGHFVNHMKRLRERVNSALPTYAHGYNVAFANPGQPVFLPPAGSVAETEDFHDIAKDHGLIMDESARGWSNPNWSAGTIRPFYEAMCNEADYVTRIGGLPLFITFDVRSPQDEIYNVLIGLAAGERYTYRNSPGDFAFGSLPKFLTRFSAFVWDDTARVIDADKTVNIKIGKGPKDAKIWFDRSTWLRRLPDGRQQLLVNLINPPNYPAFCDRAQTPPATLSDVTVTASAPAGAKLLRAAHVSPDIVDGIEMLEPTGGASVTLPRLRTWSIVVFEYGATDSAPLKYPAFALTTPVEDAQTYLADAAKKKEAAAIEQKKKVEAGVAPAPQPTSTSSFEDYSRAVNADAEAEKAIVKPADLHLRRNGVLDVHHARGVFAWLNPIESAVGLCGPATYQPSWVDRVGFRLGPAGDMDGFPDDYESLLSNDVLVLDNIHAVDLGARRRIMIADFVKNGGGLLVMGGYYNLSMGADHNSALADVLPVTIRKYDDMTRSEKGMPLAASDATFAWNAVDWPNSGQALSVDTSPLKSDAHVLAKAGDHPAIVGSTYGKGRVIVVLMNPHGDFAAASAKPYWESAQWPRILASCVAWVAGDGVKEKYARPPAEKKALDPKKPDPMSLMMESDGLDAAAFTQRLRDATGNMVDAANARTLLQAALSNVDKVQDAEVVAEIAQAAGPYLDASFAPLARELASSQEASLRRVGYRVLGLAGDKSQLPLIQKGMLENAEPENAREALLAAAALGDPKAIPAIEAYLAKAPPSQKILPLAVLKRLGRTDVMPQALTAYVEGVRYASGTKIAANQAFEQLHGGMAFSLSPAARRAAQRELARAQLRAQSARADVDFFAASINSLTDSEIDAFTSFAVSSESKAIIPLAYAVYGRLPRDQFAKYQSSLREAKLDALRLMAAGS